MDTPKLTRRERENIIFQFLKGTPNPLYDVKETNHGKYVVLPKQIQIEEEEEKPESRTQDLGPRNQRTKEPNDQSRPSRQQLRRERRKANRRAKADAYRILEQLNRLLNVQEQEADDYERFRNAPNNVEFNDEKQIDDRLPEDNQYKAPSLIEQPNLNNQPGPLSFRRKRLRF